MTDIVFGEAEGGNLVHLDFECVFVDANMKVIAQMTCLEGTPHSRFRVSNQVASGIRFAPNPSSLDKEVKITHTANLALKNVMFVDSNGNKIEGIVWTCAPVIQHIFVQVSQSRIHVIGAPAEPQRIAIGDLKQ